MSATSDRAEELAAFYARHAEKLQRIVRGKVRSACAQTIEDACQTAWATLVRRDDITLDERGARWLATVAIHEGWRLTTGGGDVPMGAMRAGATQEGELPEPLATAPAADEQVLARIEHAQRLVDLRALKANERRDLYLQALGYRYSEIARATGSSYARVNRRLTDGRAHLRRLQRERDAEDDPAGPDEGRESPPAARHRA